MRDDLPSLVADLVRIDSVNPALDPSHPGEGEIARFVADWSEQRGLEVRWLERAPGRPSVTVTARGRGGGRTLLLNGHLDTVGVEGMDAPFEPVVEGDRLLGRGVMDMKGSLAACLLTVAAAKERGSAGDVILTAVADEEHDSIGTREALEDLAARGVRVDGAIVAEPSDLALHVAHRGFSVMRVDLQGRASHTSRPQDGVNALTHLGRLLGAVEARAVELQQAAPHPLLAFGSLQPVLAQGGKELFTTPASARVTIERRTLPGETTADARVELQAMLDRLGSEDPTFRAELSPLVAREPFEAGADSELEHVLVSAITAVHGAPPERLGAPYWTDAALVAAAGIPTLLFGPVGGGIHQPTEWLDLPSLATFAGVLDEVVVAFCGA